jgi:thiol:disulfide interchange protein DsbD
MERTKQFMGFLLLATLLFLLYVLGAQRGLEAQIWAGAFLLVLSIICWIKGAFVTPLSSTRAKVIARLFILTLLVAGGWYFVGNKFAGSQLPMVTQAAAGDWQAFTPSKLEAELNEGKIVFVDFTAAWCITCKYNEANILESAAVRESFQRHGVTKMRADWTNGDPEITKLLQRFGRPGVPLYVLYPGKQDQPFVFPELLTKGIVLDKLESLSRTVASQ